METQTQPEVTPAAGVYLGPARVRGVMDAAILVEINGGLERATLALAYPYLPALDDTVLVLGQDDRFYVFGILDGHGVTRLDFPGDVELRAAGRIRLESRVGLDLDSDRITLRAERLDMVVRTVTEQFVTLYRRIEETLRTVAGREKKTIENESTLHAGRIVRKAEGDIIMDGEQIKLG
jgi:hypothetical protein